MESSPTPSSSAQAPIAVDVERARRDFRRERQLRFFRGLRHVLLIVVPLALLAVSCDRVVAAFLVFNNRAEQAEAKGTLRCLAMNAMVVTPWTGQLPGGDLRGPCFTEGAHKRAHFNYDYEDRGDGIFAATGARVYPDMIDDLWVVDGARGDHEPVNCVDRVPARGFFTPRREPSTAPACIQYWSTFPPSLGLPKEPPAAASSSSPLSPRPLMPPLLLPPSSPAAPAAPLPPAP